MKKNTKILIAITSLIISLIPMRTYANFADLEYPPNSSGKADYTDETADKNQEKVEKPEEFVGKSSNNNLKSLMVENAKMEPDFNRQYVDYTVTLNNKNDKKITIKAEAEDKKATIDGIGEKQLKEGINDFKIVVTAENGNVQIYNLIVKLPKKQSELRLNSLKVLGINSKTGEKEEMKLNPIFESNIFEYSLNINNEIDNLIIESNTNKNSFVEIKGNIDIQVGSNRVTIRVVDKQNNEKDTIYVLNVKREENTEKELNKKHGLMILLSFVSGLIIVIIVIKLIKKKK